jgi:hypothetical protein
MSFWMKTTIFAAAFTAAAIFGGADLALADDYPERPLQLVVPFPPGGASDVVARIIAGELEARLGKPVIVMNRPGGGTTIAGKEVARAAPDGYTLFFSSNSTFTLPAAVKETVPYDAAKDFEPLGQVGKITLVLVTYKDNPIKDLTALVAEAKANPDKLSLASFGAATVSHFAGELFKSSAGIKMVHLPYKGSAPAMNDLIGKAHPVSRRHRDRGQAAARRRHRACARGILGKADALPTRCADPRGARLFGHRFRVLGSRRHAEGTSAGRTGQADGHVGSHHQQPHRGRALHQSRIRAGLRALQ